MPRPRVNSLSASAIVLTFVVGVAAQGYGRWARPLLDADIAAAEGRRDDALMQYRRAEERFARFSLTRLLFAREHATAVANQLALLYHAGDYNGVIDKAAASPSAAAPHFWAGLSLVQLGMAEGREDAQLVWFSRAEEELKSALQTAPHDWDTKVDYEIAARVVAEMRRQPKRRIENPLQLLRPQPAPGTPPRKIG